MGRGQHSGGEPVGGREDCSEVRVTVQDRFAGGLAGLDRVGAGGIDREPGPVEAGGFGPTW